MFGPQKIDKTATPNTFFAELENARWAWDPGRLMQDKVAVPVTGGLHALRKGRLFDGVVVPLECGS